MVLTCAWRGSRNSFIASVVDPRDGPLLRLESLAALDGGLYRWGDGRADLHPGRGRECGARQHGRARPSRSATPRPPGRRRRLPSACPRRTARLPLAGAPVSGARASPSRTGATASLIFALAAAMSVTGMNGRHPEFRSSMGGPPGPPGVLLLRLGPSPRPR